MSISFEHPPVHRGRHRRTVSVRTLDTVLENSISAAPSSRPSTASIQSSFQTAFSSLEGSPFRYYLPHINTSSEAICTKNSDHAFNTAYGSGVQIHQVGRFYHYIPDDGTAEDDVYTDGWNVMFDTLRGHGNLYVRPEQKVVGKFRGFSFDDSREIKSPLSYIGPKDFPYRPEFLANEEVNVDVGSYTAGERLEPMTVVGGDEKRRKMLIKGKHRRSKTVADVSEKLKEMLRRLHLGKKAMK